MKRLIKFKYLFLYISLVISSPSLFAQSGTIGDLTWELEWDLNDNTAKLYIKGDGEMLKQDSYPWHSYSNSITEIYICSGVKNVIYAFWDFRRVEYIYISDTVASIEEWVLSNFENLSSINMDKNNPIYSSIDGVLYDKLQQVLITYPRNKQGSYTVPNTVGTIKNGAFSNCNRLTCLNLGKSVSVIESYYSILHHCSDLIEINVHNENLNYSSIEGVLYDKKQKTLICFPKKKQGDYIVPNTVERIGSHAFSNCKGLSSVVMEDSVIDLGNSAFEVCENLITVKLSESIDSVRERTFWGCDNLETVNIPNSATYIGPHAYSACRLRHINIPNSVKYIDENAFYYCFNARSINIPSSVIYIADSSFSMCLNVLEINVAEDNPEFCSIDDVLFDKSQKKLILFPPTVQGDFIIPNTVERIGSHAFFDSCLTSVTIGELLNEIPNRSLSAGNLKAINVVDGNAYFSSIDGVLFDKSKKEIIQYPRWKYEDHYTIPNTVEVIGHSSFHSSILPSITIPESVVTIGAFAFTGCNLVSLNYNAINCKFSDPISFYCDSLKKIIVSDKVISIPDKAFSYCINLKEVSISNSVTSLGKKVFPAKNLEAIYCHAIIPPKIESNTFSDYSGSTEVSKNATLFVPCFSILDYQEKWPMFYNYQEFQADVPMIEELTVKQQNNELFLNWKSINAPYYHVFRNNELLATVATTNYHDTDLIEGEEYCYQVSATNGDCETILCDQVCETFRLSPKISFDPLPEKIYGDTSFELHATNNREASIRYSSSDTHVASVVGNVVTIHNAGETHITASIDNLEATPVQQLLIVNKAPLTIKAENKTRQVGEANPEFTLLIEGFKKSDSIDDLDELPTISCHANMESSAGIYDIVLSGGTDNNYSYKLHNGQLEVMAKPEKKTQTVTFDPFPNDIEYRDSRFDNFSFQLKANSDAKLPVVFNSSNEEVATINGNMLTFLNAGAAIITAYAEENDEYLASDPIQQVIMVFKAPLVISAENKTRQVGEANPEFTSLIEGFKKSDSIDDLDELPTISCHADIESPAGFYDIVLSGGLDNNYSYKLHNGQLEVIAKAKKKTQTVTFDPLPNNIEYGDSRFDNFSFQLKANSDAKLPVVFTSSNEEVATINGNMLIFLNAGAAIITAYAEENDEYLASDPIQQVIMVFKAPLVISAENKTRQVGETNPEFTLLIDGFKKNDSIDDLDKLPTISCDADAASPAGFYDIVLSGGSDNNYSYTLYHGTLEVTSSSSVADTQLSALSVYPNPVKDYVNIQGASGKEIFIYNSLGNCLINKRLQHDLESISVSSWSTGVYFVVISDGGKVIKTMRLIKQ